MAEVTIQLRDNGPILVSGPFRLVDQEGNVFDLGGKDTIALCRCGHSKNKPFCDGSHRDCGFVASERAAGS